MAHTKKIGITGRFGVRYGLRTRRLVKKIEDTQKIKHICPSCRSAGKVKRLSLGVWQCRKCEFKFTNRAYEVSV